MNIKYYSREEIAEACEGFINPCNILVDVGCGIRPYIYSNSKFHVCIEPFKEYINIAKSVFKDLNMLFLNNYALEGLRQFPDKSVDTVIMIDLIEHLTKEDGYALLQEADRITKKQIVVFTPLGYLSNHREGNDAWGLNGQEMQEHKSGWLPEDFGEDWEFHICKDYHIIDDINISKEKTHGCLWAVKNKNIKDELDSKTPEFVVAASEFIKEMQTKKMTERFARFAPKYVQELFVYKIKKILINCHLSKKIRKIKRNEIANRFEYIKKYYTSLAFGLEIENPNLITPPPQQEIVFLILKNSILKCFKLPLDLIFQRKFCCV